MFTVGRVEEVGILPLRACEVSMPMETLVSCVGDFATLGGSVSRDFGPAIPLVRFLFFLFFLLSTMPWEWKVLLRQLPCAVTELSSWDVVTGARRGERSLSGQILGWSVIAFPDFSGYSHHGLLITVCSLPFMLI